MNALRILIVKRGPPAARILPAIEMSRVQRFEDVVNGAIVQVALVLSQELHVPQKLLAVSIIQ